MNALADSEVNCLALSCDGTVLVAGEQSGNLHFIHVTSRKTFLSKVPEKYIGGTVFVTFLGGTTRHVADCHDSLSADRERLSLPRKQNFG